MSDLTLKAILLGEDKSLSKTLKDGGDEADKTSGKLSAMGKVAAVGLAGLAVGVAAVFKTGLDEQSDFLKGQAQLEAGVKSTGGAANATVSHMEDLASSIQGYSGQTDDSIVASEQLLLTFTNIQNQAGKNNDIFDQTVKVSADMAAKMGGDASSSAIQLGKALNDPVKGITALTRVGVSFTQGQKDQIAAMVASGNTLGAQKVILAELNKEFGGSAKAAGETLPGQMAIARRSFEDVSQSVVVSLMPVLVKLANILTQYILPAFKATVGFIQQNQRWLVPLAVAIGAVILALKAWAIIQAIVDAELWANPVGVVILAVGALAAAIYLLVTNWQTVVTFLQGPWGTAIAGAIAVVAPFIGIPLLIIGHWQQLVDFFTGIGGKITSATAGMWDGIKSAFKSAINWLIDGWNHLHFHVPGFSTPFGSVGGFDVGLGHIDRLAQGGIIPATPGGRLFIGGEGGSAEAVIPLNKYKNGLGGDTYHITVNARSNDPKDIADALVAAVRTQGRKLPIASAITS